VSPAALTCRALRSRFDVADGHVIHTRASPRPIGGDRAAVVLVHGLLVSSRYMLPTAERLARDHAVFVPDLPGWGRTSKPSRALTVPELADVLAAWLDALALERAILVANSFGCQIVVDLAARYSERAAGLVLLGPTVDPHARRLWKLGARWLLNVPLEPPGLDLIAFRDLLDMGVRRLVATIRVMLDDRVELKLPLVTIPTVVVRGGRDSTVPRRWASEAARLLPDGRLIEVPGAPHTINYNAPDAVAAIVREFVRSLATGRPAHRT
jgi:pimeloyl-ACP methyl ester carboxylesterase